MENNFLGLDLLSNNNNNKEDLSKIYNNFYSKLEDKYKFISLVIG